MPASEPTELAPDPGDPHSRPTMEQVRADWNIPNWDRHPLLESVLRGRLSDITWDTIEQLAARGTPEDSSIEFKVALYGIERHLARDQVKAADRDNPKKVEERVEDQRAELGKDVTAFANAGGGLIVLGVAEGNGRAQRALGVPLNDTHRSRIVDVIRDRTSPYISGIEVGHVPSPDNPDTGIVLIYVPASLDGPHAESPPNERRYRYSVRDGNHVRDLTQPQITAAFRDRYAARNELDRSVAAVYDQGVGELDNFGRVWLAVAASPTRAALPRMLDQRLLDEVVAHTRARQDALPGARLGHHAFYGRGRVVLRDRLPEEGAATDHLLHCYTDGRAFAAVSLDLVDPVAHASRLSLDDDAVGLRVGSLTVWTLFLLGTVAGHVADSGAAGDIALRCGLITSTSPKYGDASQNPAARQHVMCDQSTHSRSDNVIPGSIALKTLTPVTMSATPMIATDARELAAVSAQIVTDFVVEFGRVPTYPILTADGLVRADHCDTRLGGFEAWATSRGIVHTDNHS